MAKQYINNLETGHIELHFEKIRLSSIIRIRKERNQRCLSLEQIRICMG